MPKVKYWYCIKHIFILTTVLWANSCNRDKPNEQRILFNDLESSHFSSEWGVTDTRVNGSAHSGQYFSRITEKHPLGLNYYALMPTFVRNRNFALEVSFYYRFPRTISAATLSVTFTVKDSVIFQESYAVSGDSALRKWKLYKNKIKFPSSIPTNSFLSVTLKGNKKGITDIDDVQLLFGRIQRPSFVIAEKKEQKKTFFNSFSYRPVFKNKYYTLLYSEKLGDLEVRSIKNEMIFSSLKYYIKWKKGTNVFSSYADKFNFIPGDKNEMRLSAETPVSYFDIVLKLDDSSPLIKAETRTTYKDSLELMREAVVLDYVPGLNEVYRSNTLIDKRHLRNEYWLDKEGFKIGSGSDATYFYHNTDISSTQMDFKQKEIILNLDYSNDHPLHKSEEKTGKVVDASNNRCRRNSFRESSFYFFVGMEAGSFPRLMRIPYGYLSAFILTDRINKADAKEEDPEEIGTQLIYKPNNYFNEINRDSTYGYHGHLIRPYPGYGDFIPTPLCWNNVSQAMNVYWWRTPDDKNYISDSLLNVRILNDFVENRGVVTRYCSLDTLKDKKKEYVKLRAFLSGYIQKKYIGLLSVGEAMEYWLAEEKVKIRLLPDGRFRFYNTGYQTIHGLSVAIKADSVLLNGQSPADFIKDKNGDIILWFDLKGLQSRTITVVR